jgi:sodium pump decarboxylase gamma subunit
MDYIAIGLQLTATGMTIVFFGLVLLFVMMSTFRLFEQRKEQPKAQAKVGTTPSPSLVDAESPSPEVLAVISAAVAESFGRTVRVKRVRFRSTQDIANTWSKQGRVTIMGSHHTRR